MIITNFTISDVKFVIFGALIFFNCERTCDLTDVQAWIYDRKMVARRFDTIHVILRTLRLAQSLLNVQIWYKRESTHMTLSGTDRLIFMAELILYDYDLT